LTNVWRQFCKWDKLGVARIQFQPKRPVEYARAKRTPCQKETSCDIREKSGQLSGRCVKLEPLFS